MILDTAGILIMAVLGGARLSQMLAGEWCVFPLFAHAVLSAFLLILRSRISKKPTPVQQITAWVSALPPVALTIQDPSSQLPRHYGGK
ncbi:MAG: hypothetical protein J7L66_02320, partial [Anaerolineaceae bacterium]|nr:hypothetical protein [Anaerolineaceae bacterium]